MIGYAARATPPPDPIQRSTNPLPGRRSFTTKSERQQLAAVVAVEAVAGCRVMAKGDSAAMDSCLERAVQSANPVNGHLLEP